MTAGITTKRSSGNTNQAMVTKAVRAKALEHPDPVLNDPGERKPHQPGEDPDTERERSGLDHEKGNRNGKDQPCHLHRREKEPIELVVVTRFSQEVFAKQPGGSPLGAGAIAGELSPWPALQVSVLEVNVEVILASSRIEIDLAIPKTETLGHDPVGDLGGDFERKRLPGRVGQWTQHSFGIAGIHVAEEDNELDVFVTALLEPLILDELAPFQALTAFVEPGPGLRHRAGAQGEEKEDPGEGLQAAGARLAARRTKSMSARCSTASPGVSTITGAAARATTSAKSSVGIFP